MLKNKATLFASCLVLSIAAVYVGAKTQPAGVASLRATAPQTVRVRLTEVETNADLIDSPLAGATITIRAGATTLSRKTDKNGMIVFDAVPCGQEIVITAKGGEDGEDGVFRRRLQCTGAQVDLGVIERSFGGPFTLKQRKTQYMVYDPSKNVWRDAAGKVIPWRTFKRITTRRGWPPK